MTTRPRLHGPYRRRGARAVVLVLHGGTEESTERPRVLGRAALRMLPFAWAVRRAGFGRRGRRVAVARLQYRHRGWNAPRQDPVTDVRWALSVLRDRHPGVPVVLLGHSMGGRAALRAAGEPGVAGVVVLAPWVPKGEPVEQLAGRTVVLLHGGEDERTSPRATARYAARAAAHAERLVHLELSGSGHALLERWREWHRLGAQSALAVAGLAPFPHPIDRALADGGDERIGVVH